MTRSERLTFYGLCVWLLIVFALLVVSGIMRMVADTQDLRDQWTFMFFVCLVVGLVNGIQLGRFRR